MMINSKKALLLCSSLMLLGCADSNSRVMPLAENSLYGKERSLDNFQDYVQFLKAKARAVGVSESTLNTQTNIEYQAKAVELDKQQAGKLSKRLPHQAPMANPNGVTHYLERVLTPNKVEVALGQYEQYLPQLTNASQKYGVQKAYLLALWGMESSFGRYQGKYDVLSALATLAFDGRRESLFSREFVAAMQILELDHIQRGKMLGSWAGAMGQTQFMPTSFLRYAVDGDNDGEKDIWKNHYDVFASIANYLHSVGWNDHLPWGVEVHLSQRLDLALAGVEKGKQRSLQAWKKLGIILANATPQEMDKLSQLSNTELWLVRPDRELGRAFLVSNNFRTLLNWNRSNYFAVSIGMFADLIQQGLVNN